MRSICFLFLLTLTFGVCAQDNLLRETLSKYYELIGNKEVSEALDYVHPDLINMLGKETFEAQYHQLFNSPGIEVTMEGFATDSVSDVHEADGKKYYLVDYSFTMTFVVDVSDDDSGLLPGVLLSSYQSKFGKENVSSETPGTYVIAIQREMFAVESPAFEGWKILDFEEGMRMFLTGIIPEEVLKHFNR
ncbi:MAG: hypothetical protein HEP71_32495 [Roseivirga sp.]|nr:hypothetical protein [Roseivirga sp.]